MQGKEKASNRSRSYAFRYHKRFPTLIVVSSTTTKHLKKIKKLFNYIYQTSSTNSLNRRDFGLSPKSNQPTPIHNISNPYPSSHINNERLWGLSNLCSLYDDGRKHAGVEYRESHIPTLGDAWDVWNTTGVCWGLTFGRLRQSGQWC